MRSLVALLVASAAQLPSPALVARPTEYFVSAAAPAGGDGSAASPFSAYSEERPFLLSSRDQFVLRFCAALNAAEGSHSPEQVRWARPRRRSERPCGPGRSLAT
jgi:hypothetical protein